VGKLYRDKDWLYNQYVIKQRTLKDIGDELGVRPSTIHVWRVKLGIEKVIRPSDNNTYVPVQCKQCKEDFETNIRYLWRRFREEERTYFFCSNECQTESLRGIPNPNKGLPRELNPSWKGGISPINNNLRASLKMWQEEVFREQNYTCFITGEKKGNLNVHHVTPFHKLRDNALKEEGLLGKKYLYDITEEEFERLKDRLIELHKNEEGYVLKEQVHGLFHREYGFDTTKEDLLEFKERYLSGEFDEKEAIA